MERVLVEKVKLQKAQASYRKLKTANAVNKTLLVICTIIITILSIKLIAVSAVTIEPPLFIGHGTMEQISDNVYEIKEDNYILEEITLPPMPQVKP